jgi:hypothetical protein
MLYNGRILTESEFDDLVRTISARVIDKRFHSGRIVNVGDIVRAIMKRSGGASEYHVTSLVADELHKFIKAQPAGTVCRA